MKPDIRLIALDMDGTLLDADHATIPPRNIQALRAAAAQGAYIAIATGRSWSLVRETAAQLGVVSHGITANGALALDVATGKPLAKFPMDPKQCVEIVHILRKYGLFYDLYADGNSYVQESEMNGARDYSLSEAFYQMFQRNVTLVPDMAAWAAATLPEKFDIFYVPTQQRAAILQELEATGPLSIASALQTNLELTAQNVNKGRALAALAGSLGLKPQQVMAFGDADNDLEMLRWAGWSFAMGNGTDQAKAAAKFVTENNRDGGVGLAVEKYLLESV